jgi:hypothetical protein
MQKWNQQEEKPTDFAAQKKDFVFSGSTAGRLSYGVGLVEDHSEEPFSYMKMEMLAVDERGNQSPLAVHSLGLLGANCDVIAAIEHATEEPRKVKLTDRKTLVVSRSKKGVYTLAFYEAYRKGMKPDPKGAYDVEEKPMQHYIGHLRTATQFISANLQKANLARQNKPQPRKADELEPQVPRK